MNRLLICLCIMWMIADSSIAQQTPSAVNPDDTPTNERTNTQVQPRQPIILEGDRFHDSNPAPSNTPSGTTGRTWIIGGELLLWYPSGDPLPALVTTGPVQSRTSAGVLGQPGTSVLFGNRSVNNQIAAGFRLRAATWLDSNQTWGLEGSYFFLANQSSGFSGDSSQYSILARPFVNAQTGAQDSQLLSLPGTVSGTVQVNDNRTGFYGFDLNARTNLCCCCNYRLDLLAGYRNVQLSDDLMFQEQLISTARPSAILAGTTISLQEHIRTANSFNGAQVGLAGDYRWQRLSLGFRGLVALGDLHHTVDIGGRTVVTVPGQAPTTIASGLLAQPSNSGRYNSDQLGVATEVGLTLGFQVTDHFQVTVGYSLLYLSSVVRPGSVIDTTVNPIQLITGTTSTTPSRPLFVPQSTDFWAQGINFGLIARY